MIKRLASFAIASVAVIACLAAATPAQGAPSPEPVAPPTSGQATPAPVVDLSPVDPGAAQALAASKGISVAEARKRLERQKGLGEIGSRVEAALRGATGGSYLDGNGQLVVTTVDVAGDSAATQAGAKPQRVSRKLAALDAIVKRLDQASRSGGAGSVQGWYIDVPTNTVVVTLTDGATDPQATKLVRIASKFGDSVRFESRPASQMPSESAEYLVGGFQYNFGTSYCSVGFNTVDSANRPVVLTAGHCLQTSPTVSRNGFIIGASRTLNFPTDDFGTFWNSYPSYWIPTASVYKWNNTYMNVRGSWDNAPVGTTVCKSGRTTGWTCGVIQAYNQTVNYSGRVVYGLVRHNACVEEGDSGGANMSTGGYALGITSGASLYAGKCGSRTGQANTSYYQPIGEALSRNGLRLVATG